LLLLLWRPLLLALLLDRQRCRSPAVPLLFMVGYECTIAVLGVCPGLTLMASPFIIMTKPLQLVVFHIQKDVLRV
jgi:hypothetical protein